MFKVIFTLISLISINAFALEQKTIEITCNVLDNEKVRVTASVYKDLETGKLSRSIIKLVENKVKGRTLKVWKTEADLSNHFFIRLKGKNVELKAFGDDVGAMSSIKVINQEQQLQCDIQFLEV